MNFSAQTKSWIILIAMVAGGFCGSTAIGIAGHENMVVAVLQGVATAALQVTHAFMTSPTDQPNKAPMQDIGKTNN